MLTYSRVQLCFECPSLDSTKPHKYLGLFAEDDGPPVLLKWANSAESDSCARDLLDVVANELSNAQESVFTLYCLNWLHKHRPFSLRHGFQCGKDVSANADISIRFKGLIDGKYEGKAKLDTLFSQARQCGKEYIRRNGMSYHGLEGLSFAFVSISNYLKSWISQNARSLWRFQTRVSLPLTNSSKTKFSEASHLQIE